MNNTDISMVQALSLASSTFAMGMFLGWVLALIHLGGSSDGPNRRDKEE